MKKLKLFLFIISVVYTSNISAQTVYITDTGEKYHSISCRYLKQSKHEVSLEKAQQRGYSACKVCKPSTKKSTSVKSATSSKTTSSTKSTATRCTGTTKSGSRCKRKTKSASGRCYQH